MSGYAGELLDFESDMTYVWGPPGTGKTTTVARIVEGHYRAGRSFLLVPDTNIALDTALEKLCDRLKGDPDLHGGAVLRYGNLADNSNLRAQYGPQVVVDQVVARFTEEAQRELQAVQSKLSAVSAEAKSLNAAVQEHEDHRLASLRADGLGLPAGQRDTELDWTCALLPFHEDDDGQTPRPNTSPNRKFTTGNAHSAEVLQLETPVWRRHANDRFN